MARRTRREFLADVGRGMLVAGLGTALADDLGISPAWADQDMPVALDFGALEPLVSLMQETPPSKLTALLVDRLNSGTDLRTLTAAGALANARTFGGEDYVGFHTFMALAPAYRMAKELPLAMQPLPVLKVLYRNANRIQEFGGRKSEVLKPVIFGVGPIEGTQLRDKSRKGDVAAAESTFASLARGPIGEAFNHLQFAVEDEVDVHRVVLCWRGWDTLEIAGKEWAHALLRQSVRYCAGTERRMIDRGQARGVIRTVLPNLLSQYKLEGRDLGTKPGEDRWVDELARTIFRGTREQAGDAAAQALHDGYSAEAVGEAISLAANMLVLHDPGREQKWANADKPAGSCHGDSVGVHASDAANAWRNIARVSNPRNTVASLIVGAFHTGGQSERANEKPYPWAEQLAAVRSDNPARLLAEADEAIRANEQLQAAAAIARYGELGGEVQPAFDLLLKFATSEDGALHAEKYYHTARTEFDSTRSAFRWRQVVALARVTASEYGHKSPGYEEARKQLNV